MSSLNACQLETPLSPSHWTPKDVMAHLYAWLTRSEARLQAAVDGGEPVYPVWPPEADPNLVEDGDQSNVWLYEQFKDLPWHDVFTRWSTAYQTSLSLADQVDEYRLIEWEMFDWMGEAPLVEVLLGSYMHHKEHYDHLIGWLKEHKEKQN